MVFVQNELGTCITYHRELGNVHRFSPSPRGRLPIVARFIYYKDLQGMLDNACNLRHTSYGIRRQFP